MTPAALLGADHVIVDTTRLEDYGHDKTEDYFMPDAVVRPGTTEEVSKILRICNQHRIPVTPRGAGTGLSGGHFE